MIKNADRDLKNDSFIVHHLNSVHARSIQTIHCFDRWLIEILSPEVTPRARRPFLVKKKEAHLNKALGINM